MILRHLDNATNLARDITDDQIMPVIAQHWDEPEEETDAMHIQDDAFDTLLKWQAVEDTPEVFKRVRFLTQWYNADDSRDTSFFRVGPLKIWHMAGSALAHAGQIGRSSILSLYQEDLCLPFKRTGIRLWLAFLGANRQDSIPVLLIYSKSKQNRERTLRIAKKMQWFPTSNIKIAAFSSTVFEESLLRHTPIRRVFFREDTLVKGSSSRLTTLREKVLVNKMYDTWGSC